MKQKHKRLLTVLATLAISTSLIACDKDNQNEISNGKVISTEGKEDSKLNENDEPIRYIKDSGTIRIGQHGAIRIESETKAPITIDFFFDPVCKASAEYFEAVKDVLKVEIEAGNAELVVRPIPYLNEKTPDDYSNRASAYILAVAEYAPTKVFNFVAELVNLDFQPQNPATDSTDDVKFIRAMEKAGLGKTEIDKVDSNKENFVARSIVAATDFFADDSKWTKFSVKTNENGDKMLYTPFVLVNQSGEYKLDSIPMTLDPLDYLDKHIQNLLSKINEEQKQSELNKNNDNINDVDESDDE